MTHQYWYLQVYPVTTPSCSPLVCASLGANCGQILDGCGGMLDCGACAAGQACGAGPNPAWNVCGDATPACTPDPNGCGDSQVNCGPAQDGCGNLVQCGTCSAGQTCGGGGTPGQCGGPYTAVQNPTATIYSDDPTGITIPPGMLQSGQSYMFGLHAVSRSGVDYESTPTRGSIPNCDAAAYSDIFTAP
jgi:hypothetical protein